MSQPTRITLIMYIPFDFVSLSDTESVTIRIESEILKVIESLVEEELLDNYTQLIRKAIRFFIKYRKIPIFELTDLLKKYEP